MSTLQSDTETLISLDTTSSVLFPKTQQRGYKSRKLETHICNSLKDVNDCSLYQALSRSISESLGTLISMNPCGSTTLGFFIKNSIGIGQELNGGL